MLTSNRSAVRYSAITLALLCAVRPLGAQDRGRGPHAEPAPGRIVPAPAPPTADLPESVTVVPEPEYRARWWRVLFNGAHYRDLWATPIRVPVIDLARYGGGLTPVETGGGQQTISLHLKGADGIEYVLRSVDKRPKLPEELHRTVVEDVVRDEISATHPSAALVVAPLLDAAGVLHVKPSLVVIPDDPRLGPYRAEFAGMLAELEGRPKTKDGEEGFEGASKVEKTEKLFGDLNISASNRVDARGYLTARLMDFYVGDYDRNASQWRWARFGGKDDRLWRPIPLDRDWAFMRSDGLLSAAGRMEIPQLLVFGPKYPDLLGLTYEEWDQDRRLLQSLERPVFDSVARWLQRALTDSVIADAVAHMPVEEQAKGAPPMIAALRARRAQLPAIADAFYRQMAWDADVHATTEASIIAIARRPDTLEIRMRRGDADTTDPYFVRRFVRGETHEVRIYLDGGPDRITLHGDDNGVNLRVIAGANGDTLTDSATDRAGKTIVYDNDHPVQIADGVRAPAVDSRHWQRPKTVPGPLDRDVGQWCVTLPGAQGGSDAGAAIGLTLTCDEFGFRRSPWALENAISVGYVTGTGGGSIDYLGQLRPVGGHEIWSLHATAVSSQFNWFFGMGNNTTFNNSSNAGETFYRGRQLYAELNPGLTIPFDRYTTVTVSPYVRYWDTSVLGGFINATRPYGVGPFGSIGATVETRFDTRDTTTYATRGFFLHVTGRATPAVWNVQDPYGKVRATATTYLTAGALPFHPTLALRVGGEKVWGMAPFQDLAHIGADAPGEPSSVRGYIADRFTGNAAAFGNAQLEVPLGRPKLLVPTEVGLLAINDIGRVFVPNDVPSHWHDGVGGGFFLAPVDRRFTASATLVHGTDGTRLYFGSGLGL